MVPSVRAEVAMVMLPLRIMTELVLEIKIGGFAEVLVTDTRRKREASCAPGASARISVELEAVE